MKQLEQLIDECISRNLHFSLSYQSVTEYSIEIYTGYVSSYKLLFYTDGHISIKKAAKTALSKLREIK